jgi:hypothetical protein
VELISPIHLEKKNMTDINTVPRSILQRLEQVQSLASQQRMPEAGNALAQTLVEIARTQPELCAVMMAAQLGYREISFQQTVRTTNRSSTDKSIFGITYGQDNYMTTTSTTTTKTVRLR